MRHTLRWPSSEWLARQRRSVDEWSGLRAGLAVLASLVMVDLLLTADALPATYVVAPFIAALTGGRWATALIAVLAVGLAALSGLWDANLADDAYFVRVAIVAAGGVFAVLAARAVHESRLSMRGFALLNDAAAVADGSAPLPVTMRLISDLIVPQLADYCMIDVVADGRVDRVAVRATGPQRENLEEQLMQRQPSLPARIVSGDDSGLIEPRFWERVTDEHLRSIAHDPEDLEFLRGLGVTSVITVALASRGRRVGALTLISASSGRHYSRSDVRFANVLGDRVALALDNAGLFSDLQSIERRMDSVMQILDEAIVIFDRGRRLVFANDAAARLFGFRSANELIGSPEGAVRERFDLYDESGAPLAVEEFAPAKALRGEPAPPQIVRAISREDERELWLRAKSKVVEGMDGEPLFAVTALEDVTEIKVAEFEQTLLARLGELHGSALDHKEMVQRLTELVIPQLADWCSIYDLHSDGAIEHLATAHVDAERVRKAREIDAEYPLNIADPAGPAEVLRSGEPMLIADIGPLLERFARDRRHLERIRELGLGSAMMLPMRFAGSVIGALVLLNQSDRRPFDQFDRRLAEKVAERAAVALENARLATERSEIASTLQQGLLPAPLPHIPGWSVAALYRPAGAENEVGGDFYDAFAYKSGWIFVLGDVTGRGARAALITALARYTMRTASALSGDPLVALAALNRALIAREDSALCSVAAIAIGEDSTEARIAVAGHPPPLLVGPEGVREAAGTGPVLGAFPDAEWELTRVRLESGCHLVVYTDGVTEASGPDGRFGEQRVRARLLGASSPVVAVQRLEEALEAFCRGNLEDDAAIVALGPSGISAGQAELRHLLDGVEA